jgi:hypothetical protein
MEQKTMINNQTFSHFIGSAMQTLATLENLKTDGKLHAFIGANNATTGYYRITPDNKDCSVTVDYFHGDYEGIVSITFSIDLAGGQKCH